MKIKFGTAYSDGKRLDETAVETKNGRFLRFCGDDGCDIDFSGYNVFPGFIDMHTHGGGGIDPQTASFEELDRLSLFYAQNGVTAFCPTTVTCELGEISSVQKTVKQRMAAGTSGAEIIGIYVEGPYLSKKFRGAHAEHLLRTPDIGEIRGILDGGAISVFAMAPELPGALDAIKYITSRGVKVACGHSDANCEEGKAGFAAGASIAIHTYNTERSLHHRDAGLLGASLVADGVYNEIICDLIHIAPEPIDIAIRCKSMEKMIFITDSMSATGMPDGEYMLGALPVRVEGETIRTLENGALAGSALRTNIALKNVVKTVGVPIERAMLGVTANPARALGIYDEAGSIAPGKLANLTVLDNDFNVVATIREEKIIYKNR